MKNIFIIGATSAIAKATARIYAQQGASLFLQARNEARLLELAEDLRVRGAAEVKTATFDINDLSRHGELISEAFAHFGHVDLVLIAHGTLPDQKACEKDVNLALLELNTNAMSTVSVLTFLANYFEPQKSGTIAVISSVAGDRGRQSNYVYGAAKGMVSIFLQGLRNRLTSANVNVLDIKPGFVDTPMTAEFKKGPLWAKPEDIADSIVKGVDKGKYTLYTPFFWRFIMMIICSIPEFIFRKLKL